MINKIIVPGCIITALHSDWFNIPGAVSHKAPHNWQGTGRKHTWNEHFVTRKHFYRVLDIPTNNGRFTAVNATGHKYTMYYSDIIEIVKGGM